MTDIATTDNDKWNPKSLTKNLYLCAFAFMMNYSAYTGLVFLQSSINIEDGLGVYGLFVIYLTSSISTITILPSLIDFYGAKVAIIAGEVGIAVYTLANFYPSWYTIIPAAIIHGFTESASWAGTSVYVSFLGEKSWEYNKERRSKEQCIYNYFSKFYSISYFAQILGNGLVSAVFFGAAKLESSNLTIVEPFYNTSLNATIQPLEFEDWSHCGSNQCKMDLSEEMMDTSSSKYSPEDSSVLLLLIVFLSMQIVFTLVHIFGLRKIPPMIVMRSVDHDIEQQQAMTQLGGKKIPVKSKLDYFKKEIVSTFKHLVSKLHIAIIPVYFLYGLIQAFCVTEFTRAYISCTIGVQQLGFVMMVYGVSDILTSVTFIKLLPRLGRSVAFYLVVLIHSGTVFFCLLYPIKDKAVWVIYVGAALYGSCDAGYQNILQGLIALYFEDSRAIAYSIKNLIVNLGIVFGAASLFDCVYSSLYLQMAMLLVVSLSYALAELMFRRMKRQKKDNRHTKSVNAL